RKVRKGAGDEGELPTSGIEVLLRGKAGAAAHLLDDSRSFAPWRGKQPVAHAQDRHAKSARNVGASCIAKAQRCEGLLRSDEAARTLEQHALVIKHNIAQLRVYVGSQVLAGFDVSQCSPIVAELELAQTEEGTRRAMLWIDGNDS